MSGKRDPEQESDRLLHKAHAAHGKYPAYSERYLRRRERRRARKVRLEPYDEEKHGRLCNKRRTPNVLSDSKLLTDEEIAYVARRAKLSKEQLSVLEARLKGEKYKRIAHGMRCSERTVRRHLAHGLHKMARAMGKGRNYYMLVWVLAEVFELSLYEVRRILWLRRNKREILEA